MSVRKWKYKPRQFAAIWNASRTHQAALDMLRLEAKEANELAWEFRAEGVDLKRFVSGVLTDPTGAEDYETSAMPEAPTVALPGSPEKVQVLIDRVSAGVQLWHPDDVTRWSDPRADPASYPAVRLWRSTEWGEKRK